MSPIAALLLCMVVLVILVKAAVMVVQAGYIFGKIRGWWK